MDKNSLLRKYLDGELSEEQEKEALHTIAEDSDLRAMLRFEQTLAENLPREGGISNMQVPEGFTEDVMHAVKKKEQQDAHHGIILWDRLKLWSRNLWKPREMQWRPAYGFVFALLVLISFSYPLIFIQQPVGDTIDQQDSKGQLNQSVQQVSAGPEEVMLRFVYIDEDAKNVAVAGDFNNWEPMELTKKSVNGRVIWTGLVSMSRGEHNYMFVRNGDEWITDPLAPVQRDDGFGNKNAVIFI